MSKISLLPRAKPEDWLRPSVLALIAANLIPLAGVFLFGWEIFPPAGASRSQANALVGRVAELGSLAA